MNEEKNIKQKNKHWISKQRSGKEIQNRKINKKLFDSKDERKHIIHPDKTEAG